MKIMRDPTKYANIASLLSSDDHQNTRESQYIIEMYNIFLGQASFLIRQKTHIAHRAVY